MEQKPLFLVIFSFFMKFIFLTHFADMKFSLWKNKYMKKSTQSFCWDGQKDLRPNLLHSLSSVAALFSSPAMQTL